jgi:hypothetical protein
MVLKRQLEEVMDCRKKKAISSWRVDENIVYWMNFEQVKHTLEMDKYRETGEAKT